MNASDSLASLERRAYRSTFNDGIYDLAFGWIFLVLAWIPVLEAVGFIRLYAYLFLLVPLPLLWLGKRHITTPRLGAVEFGTRRRVRRRSLMLMLGAVVVLMLPVVLMMLPTLRGQAHYTTWFAVAMIVAPVVLIAVYAFDYPRLLIYVALLGFAVVEANFLGGLLGSPLHTLISFGLPGAAILIYGVVLLVRFVQRYPRSMPAENHVSS